MRCLGVLQCRFGILGFDLPDKMRKPGFVMKTEMTQAQARRCRLAENAMDWRSSNKHRKEPAFTGDVQNSETIF